MEAWTPRTTAAPKPACSSSTTPATVVPPGDCTASAREAALAQSSSFASKSFAAPYTAWAAMRVADALGSPFFTAALAMASM